MAVPRTQEELLALTARERDALQSLLMGLSREQLLTFGEYGWSAKDFLAHLSEWERMLCEWYEAGLRGESPAVPAEGYSWARMDELNDRIFELHQDEEIEEVVAGWTESSRRLIALTQTMTEADLFTPARFAWTGRGTLASFVYECGPNHYRWAAREIRRGLKDRR